MCIDRWERLFKVQLFNHCTAKSCLIDNYIVKFNIDIFCSYDYLNMSCADHSLWENLFSFTQSIKWTVPYMNKWYWLISFRHSFKMLLLYKSLMYHSISFSSTIIFSMFVFKMSIERCRWTLQTFSKTLELVFISITFKSNFPHEKQNLKCAMDSL